MKRIAIALSVVGLIFGGLILAQTQSPSVEQELIKLQNEWADAILKREFSFLDRIIADDYTTIGPLGNVYTKAQEITAMKLGWITVTSLVLDEIKVRVYGDAAVVTGRSTNKETIKGKDFNNQYRWTDTWIKLGGRWQCVADHMSRIPQK